MCNLNVVSVWLDFYFSNMSDFEFSLNYFKFISELLMVVVTPNQCGGGSKDGKADEERAKSKNEISVFEMSVQYGAPIDCGLYDRSVAFS